MGKTNEMPARVNWMPNQPNLCTTLQPKRCNSSIIRNERKLNT